MFLTSHFCLQTINPSYKGFCFQRSLSFEHAAHTHVRFTSLYFLSSQHSVWYSVNIPLLVICISSPSQQRGISSL